MAYEGEVRDLARDAEQSFVEQVEGFIFLSSL
jgi:hypothetical protein